MGFAATDAWATAPANDNFADATQLGGKFQVVDGDTNGSTLEGGEPAHTSTSASRSIWYAWTPPSSGTATVSTCDNTGNIYAQVYTGSALNTLTPLANGICRQSFLADGGTKYHIAVYPNNEGNSGPIRLYLREQSAPANDDFDTAEVLTGNFATTTGTTGGATGTIGEPDHNGSTDPNSVWYRWTAPADGYMAYDICRNDFATATAVYTGSSADSLTKVDQSHCGRRIPVTGGTTYSIAVTTDPNAPVGDFYMELRFFTTPANDNFDDAIVIPPAGGEFDGSNGGGTFEALEPNSTDPQASVWYRWTPSTSGIALIDACTEDFIPDFRIRLYAGGTVGGLSPLYGGDCRVSVPVTGGDTYQIRIVGDDESDYGDFHMKITRPAKPANDDLANAIPLSAQSVDTGGTYTGASLETNESNPSTNAAGGVWYAWTAPSNNEVTIDTCGSNFDTYLGVYTGDAPFPLTEVEKNDDTFAEGCGLRSAYTFTPTQGQTYKIGIYGFSNYAVGNYRLRIYPGAFTPLKYTISGAKSGTGSGTVFTNRTEGVNCGSVCSFQVNDDAYVEMRAVADEGSKFVGWENAPDCPGTIPCWFNAESNRTLTAVFTDLLHKTLTVSTSGAGTVTSSPAGISCGATCSHTFDTGTLVTLTAKPAPGYALSGWGGACSGKAACQVTMDDEAEVSATFVKVALTLKTGKAKLNLKKGTALLPVTVNTAAKITLTGKSVKKKTASTKAAKTVKMTIALTGKLKKKLRKKRKVIAKVKVTAKPVAGGSAKSKTVKVKLKLKKKKRR